MPDTQPADEIVVQNLHFSYPPPGHDSHAVEVLRGLDFQVARGEFVAVLGRVGAGKTTLCLALNGLAPHATGGVFRGDVLVAGLNPKRHTVAQLANTAGLVFQDPESQLVQMRVEEEVAFGLENLGLPSAEIEERVGWALNLVGLANHRDRSPLALSGGQKQRLAMAAVLAMRPRVLVLDEPTASLDPAGKALVFKTLAALRTQQDLTIIMATQEMERISRYADRVLVLHEGRLAMAGPPAEVFGQVPRLQDLGLGAPQMAELAQDLSQSTGHRYVFTTLAGARRALRTRVNRQADNLPATVRVAKADSQPGRNVLNFERVSYGYENGQPVLRDVSLTVHAGDFVVLLGANGAGKTTLARHCNGLLRPAEGRVLLDGQDTRRLSVAQLAHTVGYVFQNPDHQIFAPTVLEEIAFGLRNQGLPADLVAERVAEALARFDLAPYAGLPPALLGFGQRRKVALAAVLSMESRVLILDEPTDGLDWRSRQELMALVAAAHAAGRTVILITHDMRVAVEYGQRAIVLRNGRLLFDGTVRDLFGRPRVLAQAHLALPPVARLARRVRNLPHDTLTNAEFVAAWTLGMCKHATPV